MENHVKMTWFFVFLPNKRVGNELIAFFSGIFVELIYIRGKIIIQIQYNENN